MRQHVNEKAQKKTAEHISQEKHVAFLCPFTKQLTVKRREKKQKCGVQNEQSMINHES